MRKRTKRKIYALVNPLHHAMEGAGFVTDDQLNKLRLKELDAIDSFVNGSATIQNWHELCAMINLAELMAKQGIGPEVLEVCEDVQGHMIESAKRYERTGKMGITGPGLQALRDLYQYHDLQRQSVSRGEYEAAIRKLTNRIKSKAPEVVEI